MITLVCFVSSLTILMLSAKTYKDLQSKISDAEALKQQLEQKLSEAGGPKTSGPASMLDEEDELV